MDESPADFRKALAELVEAGSPDPPDHPSAEEWLAYVRGELAPAPAERCAEHLVRCRDCVDLVQAAAAFSGADEEGAPGDEAAAAAHWRLLRGQLFGSQDAPAPARILPARPPAARRHRLPYALAASFFVALLALAGWDLKQERELARLREPKPNPLLVDFAAGERLALPARSDGKTLAAGTGPWTFEFHPGDEFPAYRLTVRDAATGREVSRHELRLDEDSAVTIQYPEGLPPGRYELALRGLGGPGAGKLVEEHLLRVTGGREGD